MGEDIENELETKDLFQDYDDSNGEIVANKRNAIKMDKYIQEVCFVNFTHEKYLLLMDELVQLSKVGLFGTPNPKNLVHSSLTDFLNIIQLYSKEQQDVCRYMV